MVPTLPRLSILAAALALALPSAASAASRTAAATGQATVLSSLSVLKTADLDFGTLVVTGAGTAAMDPVSGTLSTTGSVTKAGTAAHAATFTGTGSKNSVVHIRIPTTPITLTRVGGSETMSVSTWTLDGAANRKVPPTDVFTFAVGATATVAAGQAEGTYVGTFSVTVQYP
jgi:hypothetical protein